MTLRVEVDGRTLTFDESRPVRIGRNADCDVVLAAMSVSRNHAELRPGPTGWMLVDAGGQLGTFVDGHRVAQLTLTGTTVVQCGPDAPGSSITVTVEMAAALVPDAAAPAPAPAPAPVGQPLAQPVPIEMAKPPEPAAPPSPESQLGYEPTQILAGPVAGGPAGMPQPRSGPDLMVEAEGREHRFRHPAQVTIGRLPASSIVITDPVASRAHLRVDPVPGGWGFTNLSREGTFLDGRRVEAQTFDDAITLRLGHPTAGPEVVLLPVLSSQEEQARLSRKRIGRRLKLGGIGVGALVVVGVLVGVLIAVLGGGSGDQPAADTMAVLTAQERDAAKAKTVLISFQFTSGGDQYLSTGSGSIISSNGLILTNAHVAAPNAPGLSDLYAPEAVQVPDPEYLNVSLTNPADGYATDGAQYRAKVVEADGNVDAAVIQIYADQDGNAVDPASLNLSHYDIGNSDDLDTGQQVTILGFPGIARGDTDPFSSHPEVTVTTGVISTFIDTDRLGKRSEIDTDARISQGNSGGSAIDNDGRLIGIPSSTYQEQDAAGYSGRIRPIAYVTDLIQKSEDETN